MNGLQNYIIFVSKSIFVCRYLLYRFTAKAFTPWERTLVTINVKEKNHELLVKEQHECVKRNVLLLFVSVKVTKRISPFIRYFLEMNNCMNVCAREFSGPIKDITLTQIID